MSLLTGLLKRREALLLVAGVLLLGLIALRAPSFVTPANLAGVPAISVPAGLDANGLPLGLQVIGKPFDEETVFAVSAAVEQAAGFDALPALRAGG